MGTGSFVAALAGIAMTAVLMTPRDTWSRPAVPRETELFEMGVAIDGRTGGADLEDAAVTCRRSDRSHSDCGPVLPVGRDTASQLVIAREDLLVVVAGDDLVSFDLDDGGERWRTTVFAGARAVRVADDGDLLFGAVAGGLAAVDTADGTIRWTRAFDDEPPAVAANGTSRTTSITPVPVWAGDGAVLAHGPDGRLHAFEREDGARRWVQPVGSDAVLTTARGLLGMGREGVRLWHPDGPDPRWRRSGTDLRLHPEASVPARARPTIPVEGPLPLTTGRWLLDLDGGMIALPMAGPIDVVMAGELTVVVTWPGEPSSGASRDGRTGTATLTAFAADGVVAWERTGVALPCCDVRAVLADGEQLVLTVDGDDVLPRPSLERSTAVVLARADGRALDVLRREGATLQALTAGIAVWQQDRHLVGVDRRTGREAFQGLGTIISAEPLLLEGPDTTIAIRSEGPIAPPGIPRPGPRR